MQVDCHVNFKVGDKFPFCASSDGPTKSNIGPREGQARLASKPC